MSPTLIDIVLHLLIGVHVVETPSERDISLAVREAVGLDPRRAEVRRAEVLDGVVDEVRDVDTADLEVLGLEVGAEGAEGAEVGRDEHQVVAARLVPLGAGDVEAAVVARVAQPARDELALAHPPVALAPRPRQVLVVVVARVARALLVRRRDPLERDGRVHRDRVVFVHDAWRRGLDGGVGVGDVGSRPHVVGVGDGSAQFHSFRLGRFIGHGNANEGTEKGEE